jgi:hypothetical protein
MNKNKLSSGKTYIRRLGSRAYLAYIKQQIYHSLLSMQQLIEGQGEKLASFIITRVLIRQTTYELLTNIILAGVRYCKSNQVY